VFADYELTVSGPSVRVSTRLMVNALEICGTGNVSKRGRLSLCETSGAKAGARIAGGAAEFSRGFAALVPAM